MVRSTGIAEPVRRGRIRWLMVTLVFGVAAVAYLDRSNISIAAPVLKLDFALTDIQLGMVFSAFVLGYAITQPIAGRMADRFGAYILIAVGIFWWSVLTAITAMLPSNFVGAFAALLGVRFILGVGESVIFPASNRLVESWIPSNERGLANGLIFAGVGFGAGVAPPLISSIMIEHDWRYAFWVTAIIGIVALIIWLLFARETPQKHAHVGQAELDYIEADKIKRSVKSRTNSLAPWRKIILNRHIALLTFSYFCYGYVAYIFFTWFFTYLLTVRGLNLRASGIYGMLPFIAMAIASPLGGWISDQLSVRYTKRIGRCYVAAAGMMLTAVFVVFATTVSDPRLAAVVLAAGSGSLYLAQSAFWTLSADIGRSSAGSVAGVMNLGSQIGGVAVGILTPILAATAVGWSGAFIFTALICFAGAVAWLFIDPHASLDSSQVVGS
ncbi:MAG TPA: MFS transporter [Woeseiaceae bacterium]|nr:MFS transporter [Woeseiaceae bacterium]